jgi:hypothetical protein
MIETSLYIAEAGIGRAESAAPPVRRQLLSRFAKIVNKIRTAGAVESESIASGPHDEIARKTAILDDLRSKL